MGNCDCIKNKARIQLSFSKKDSETSVPLITCKPSRLFCKLHRSSNTLYLNSALVICQFRRHLLVTGSKWVIIIYSSYDWLEHIFRYMQSPFQQKKWHLFIQTDFVTAVVLMVTGVQCLGVQLFENKKVLNDARAVVLKKLVRKEDRTTSLRRTNSIFSFRLRVYLHSFNLYYFDGLYRFARKGTLIF